MDVISNIFKIVVDVGIPIIWTDANNSVSKDSTQLIQALTSSGLMAL